MNLDLFSLKKSVSFLENAVKFSLSREKLAPFSENEKDVIRGGGYSEF